MSIYLGTILVWDRQTDGRTDGLGRTVSRRHTDVRHHLLDGDKQPLALSEAQITVLHCLEVKQRLHSLPSTVVAVRYEHAVYFTSVRSEGRVVWRIRATFHTSRAGPPDNRTTTSYYVHFSSTD